MKGLKVAVVGLSLTSWVPVASADGFNIFPNIPNVARGLTQVVGGVALMGIGVAGAVLSAPLAATGIGVVVPVGFGVVAVAGGYSFLCGVANLTGHDGSACAPADAVADGLVGMSGSRGASTTGPASAPLSMGSVPGGPHVGVSR